MQRTCNRIRVKVRIRARVVVRVSFRVRVRSRLAQLAKCTVLLVKHSARLVKCAD